MRLVEEVGEPLEITEVGGGITVAMVTGGGGALIAWDTTGTVGGGGGEWFTAPTAVVGGVFRFEVFCLLMVSRYSIVLISSF